MKHAYLIIAHNEPEVLRVLLSALDDSRNDVYLHIDRRVASLYHQFQTVRLQQANLYVLSDRKKVYWGDISQVEVEYLLLETALANGPYAYYHLLSGTDLPLHTQDYIHRFFELYAGREFVGFWSSRAHQRDLKRKVMRYYLFTEHLKDKGSFRHACMAFARNVVLTVQKLTRYQRSKTFDFKKGPNWMSVTEDFCRYLMEKKPLIIRRLRHTLCPDEIFVQTLLWNSPFRENIYCLDDPNMGNMREVDWERGNPYVWQSQDSHQLFLSEKLFARKFSWAHREVIDRLQSRF